MRQKKLNTWPLFLLIMFMLPLNSIAQEDSSAPKKMISLHYYNNNNSVQYVLLKSMLKNGKVLTPQTGKSYELFLDSASAATHIARMTTNAEGVAKTFIPPSLQQAWSSSGTHIFILKEGDEEVISDYSITKSKIVIDTATEEGARSVTATVLKWSDADWIPAPDVELKLGIKRQGGILAAGDEETYTTDSTGVVTVVLTKDSLPGDAQGNYILAARIEDNDELGNLSAEKTVKWGTATTINKDFFNQRTLWTTRFKAPYWLIGIALSIIIGVWGTLFYLVFLLRKTIKAGKKGDHQKAMILEPMAKTVN